MSTTSSPVTILRAKAVTTRLRTTRSPKARGGIDIEGELRFKSLRSSHLDKVGRRDGVCFTSQTGRVSRVSFPGEMSGNVALMSLWLVSGPHHTANAVINESNMT
jgi:hypothetical protein